MRLGILLLACLSMFNSFAESNLPAIEIHTFLSPPKYFQLSFGYLDSDYKHFDSSLKNGSALTDIRFMVELKPDYLFGFGIQTIQNTEAKNLPESLTALQYKLVWEWTKNYSYPWSYVYGIAFSAGDFAVRKTVFVNGEEAKRTLKSENLIGLVPDVGIRYYFLGKSSVDFVGEYNAYVGNPQKYLGGFALNLRLSAQI